VVLGVEVIHGEADPAGAEHEDGGDDLSDREFDTTFLKK